MGNPAPDYNEMWEELKHRLESRVQRMRFDTEVDRRGAYTDVLLLMGDLEDSED